MENQSTNYKSNQLKVKLLMYFGSLVAGLFASILVGLIFSTSESESVFVGASVGSILGLIVAIPTMAVYFLPILLCRSSNSVRSVCIFNWASFLIGIPTTMLSCIGLPVLIGGWLWTLYIALK